MSAGFFVNVLFDQETPEQLQERFYSHIQTYFPEWEPREPSLEVGQAELFSEIIYELTTLAADVPPTIMQNLGSLIKIPPYAAKAATVQLRFTAADNVGHTLPADTLVAWEAGTDTGIGFYTVSEAVIPLGQTTVDVTAICEVDGYIGNGFSGSPQLITLIDWISGVTALTPTDGGQDQEAISDYLDRFSSRLQLLKDRPIREFEVPIWARTVMPFIGRAIAFDNYDASTENPDAERHCTLVTHDLDGEDNTPEQVAEMMAALSLTREIGFVFHHRHPARTGIGVQVTVVAEPGWELAAVEQNVIDSLRSAFDPLNWGLPSSAQNGEWRNTTEVRLGWVYAQIVRNESVQWIEENSLLLHTTASDPIDWYQQDIALEGLAPLTYLDEDFLTINVLPAP